MSFIYVLSIILFLTILYLCPKSDRKLNGLISLIYLIGLYFCFNIFAVFILSYINIPSNLYSLTIINLVLCGVVYYLKFYKTKKISNIPKKTNQKYYFDKKEILFCIIIAVACLVVGLIRFSNFTEIRYETTDPAAHYKIAKTFSSSGSLLNSTNSTDELYKNFSHCMSGAYINDGLMMKVLYFIPSYIVFMIFDVLTFILYGILFYVTVSHLDKNKKHRLLMFFISILYVMGYPLNNMIFGFSYLGFGVFIINLILLTFILLSDFEKKGKNTIMILLLFLTNFSLFFTYYLFVPVLYLSEGLFLIYTWAKSKTKFRKLVGDCIVALVIPFIIGFSYFVLPGFINSSGGNSVTALAAEGYIYRDLFSNFILLLPILIYYFIYMFKHRKIEIEFVAFIVLIIYILIVFILGMKGLASSYYYYKLYYPLWLMSWIAIAKSISVISKGENLMLYSWFCTFLIILGIAGTKIESRIQSINTNFSPSIVANSITNIYVWNANKVIQKEATLNNDKINLIEKSYEYKDMCISNLEIPIVGNFLEKLWSYSITNIVPIYNHGKNDLSRFYEEKFDFESWKNDNNQKCLLYFYNKDYSIDISMYDTIYKNDEGILIKK